MHTLTRALVALFLFALTACQAGPSAADVAADRDRFTALSAVTADDTVSPAERPVLDELLHAWDVKLTADEQAVAKADTTVQDLLRAYGLAAVQIYLTPELKARAPEMFRLLDVTADGQLDEAELRGADPKSPVFAAVVITTAARLLARKH